MSILRPKDGDYIVRGLFLFVGWTFLGWVPFAVAGGMLAGASGAVVSALIAVALIGPFLYWLYLRIDPRSKPCVCGHFENFHRNSLECLSGRVSSTIYDPVMGRHNTARYGGCSCLRYSKKTFFNRKPSDPNDWSV